jgi:hypothetical protein
MIDNVMIKSHLIITDIHEEYSIKWCGNIIDTQPEFKNNMPIFAIVGSESRIELNTLDMKQIENCAKRLTNPRGRSAVTTDKAHIYIKEKNGKETCIGIVTHKRIKKYAPMFDAVGYKK